jgi:hypothetical protein
MSEKISPKNREHARNAFPFKQMLAPIRSGEMPWPEDLVEVECRNISQSGISLFLKSPPRFRKFVICLGPENSPIQVYGKVVRVQEIDCDGRHGFVVGCRFTKQDRQ